MEISQTADYALQVMLCLAKKHPSSTADLAVDLGLSRTTMQRIVSTLHARKMIMRERNGTYSLSPYLTALAEHIPDEFSRITERHLDALSRATGETIVVSVRHDDSVSVVATQTVARQPLRVEFQEGYSHPVTIGASGLAILAFLDEDEQHRLVPSDQARRDRLAEIAECGYALSSGEIRGGMAGLAVPVLDDESRPVASIAVVAPESRSDVLATHAALLIDAAASIGEDLASERRSVRESFERGLHRG